jgi:membrane protein DedA with SNARE-associated domain
MLEILLLWALTKRIGNIVEQKGHKSGWYKVLTVILWFGGEVTGAIVGAMMSGTSQSTQCGVYIIALMGAAAGAGIAYLIASNVSPVNPTPPPSS